MKFRYKKYGPGILRPVIPIEIIYKEKSVPYEVLIDSGADFCIFDAQIGEILNIPIEEGEKFEIAGITGEKEPVYFHLLEIEVGGWRYKIKAAFLKKIGTFGYGVVGQRGFFDIFVVKFDLLKEEIELKPRVK
jgi:hypothetical protein